MNVVICLLLCAIFIGQICVFLLHRKTLREKASEYYTDYHNGKLTLRIFKPEFEYQAVGDIPRGKLLDRGVFSQFYFWALIEK